MSKNKKKKKKSSIELLPVYGIWSFEKAKMVFLSLTLDETEFKFDIEGYDEEKYGIVQLDVVVDPKNLER